MPFHTFKTLSTRESGTVLQNFFGAVAVTTAFLPALKRTAQRRPQSERPVLAIVNSFASRVPLPTMAAYSASKAALASFVDSIRPELASSGIHVAQIQPGGYPNS